MKKRKEPRKWLVSFYSAEGQFRDALERFSKLKPTAWARRRLAEGETMQILLLED
jgi:hypothetical protein